MADNEADGAAEAAEAPAPKGKLKMILAVVAVLAIAGGGATWFFFLRHHDKEAHAEAVAPPPNNSAHKPGMLITLFFLSLTVPISLPVVRLKP